MVSVAWCRKVPGRTMVLFAFAARQCEWFFGPRAGKESAPGRRSPGEPGCRDAEKSATVHPNRQRDKTPEAKPLSAAMPHAPRARQSAIDPRGISQ
jgi:hypothetical protein